MIEETGIIKAVLQGDTESFRELVQRYEKQVYRMIKNLINDHHISEDLAQDVFLTAYKKLSSFDPARSSFSTWLFTIARNKSINVIKRKKIVSISDMPENPSPAQSSDNLMRQEFSEYLDNAMSKLPLKQKTAFVLAELEKLPYEQIAQIEGVRIGTVKSRVNRAKTKLRHALKSFEES